MTDRPETSDLVGYGLAVLRVWLALRGAGDVGPAVACLEDRARAPGIGAEEQRIAELTARLWRRRPDEVRDMLQAWLELQRVHPATEAQRAARGEADWQQRADLA